MALAVHREGWDIDEWPYALFSSSPLHANQELAFLAGTKGVIGSQVLPTKGRE